MWQCRREAADVDAPAPGELDDVALALAAGFERLDRLDLVWFPAAVLTGRAVTVKVTDGETPVVDLRSRHRDLTGLCIGKLGVVAEVVATAVGQSHHRRLTKGQLKVLLVRAINDGRLRLDDLQEKVREALAPGDG